jgi:hypothetical protein
MIAVKGFRALTKIALKTIIVEQGVVNVEEENGIVAIAAAPLSRGWPGGGSKRASWAPAMAMTITFRLMDFVRSKRRQYYPLTQERA